MSASSSPLTTTKPSSTSLVSSKLMIYHKDRSTEVQGRTSEEQLQDLYDSIKWFQKYHADIKFSDAEKKIIHAHYIALTEQLPKDNKTVFLPLKNFCELLVSPKPKRIGLEAEYARLVYPPEINARPLRYNQCVATIAIKTVAGTKILAKIKLDGVSEDCRSAILELEFRPFAINSPEYQLQLQILVSVRELIFKAEKDSSVQKLLEELAIRFPTLDIDIVKDSSLLFDTESKEVGPYCQVTLEIPLHRLGDPEDQTILALIENPKERKLLQHARSVAATLTALMRPMASKLHGDLYTSDSIKLAKLRGYWTQSIMQMCQRIQYESKSFVRFHIRTAGPYFLSARDKALLKMFFDDSTLADCVAFRKIIKQGLIEGSLLLVNDPAQAKNLNFIAPLANLLMKDVNDFEPTMFQFKSGSWLTEIESLEQSYGVTLVELRDVDSSLNKGIKENNANAISQIDAVQAPTPPRAGKKLR